MWNWSYYKKKLTGVSSFDAHSLRLNVEPNKHRLPPSDRNKQTRVFQFSLTRRRVHCSICFFVHCDPHRGGSIGNQARLLLDMCGVYSCDPTFKSYNVVLDILVDGDCPRVAPNVYYDMLSRGVSPTVYTFGVVMKALCIVNEVNSACSLLRDMAKHGCVPNSVIYQTLIHALCENNRVSEAIQLLEDMFLMCCEPDV
ncbi:Pentatricopeptide repeat-containing protein, mitochondrial [Glycine max]|nr:Pentatricopeptide repeat-containing protein, mitochondrial [Glycine max]